MKYLILFCVFAVFSVGATTFTEFYCDANIVSTNINSGDTTNASPDYTSLAGNWNQGTSTFTPTDGTFPANSNAYFTTLRWASVVVSTSTNLTQAGSKGGYIAQIATINSGQNGTIVLSTTALSGTAPGNQTGTAELRVGGAWHGPYGSSGLVTIQHPFDFIATTATNSPYSMPRVNFRNGASYSIVAGLTQTPNGPLRFQGMTATPGDRGKATFDGGTGTGYAMMNANGNNTDWVDLIFYRNGSTTANGIMPVSGSGVRVDRCVFRDAMNYGLQGAAIVSESEAYGCNRAANNNIGAFHACNIVINCVSHDNVTGGCGFSGNTGASFINCISYGNNDAGFVFTGSSGYIALIGCDAYNNTGPGLKFSGAGSVNCYLKNCNFVKNGGAAVTNAVTNLKFGYVSNCGLGSGAAANTAGDFPIAVVNLETNSLVTYASGQTPWNAPSTSDFRITLTAAKSQGLSAFTQSTLSPQYTVGYSDIGAAQASDTNSASSGGSYTFSQ